MLEKLIYLKSDFNKENKIVLENIVNLKKKNSDIPKKNKILKPYYTPTNSSDQTLIFESRFESGNLLAAFKISENNYQITLQNDTNTSGYSQWYFFRVSGSKKGVTAKFNIINLMKAYSLYKKGMKILVYSEKKAEKENLGWHRGGENISYYQNGLYKFVKDKKRSLSSLNFNYTFEYDNDTVYFANTLPYSYTDLMRELNEIQRQDKKYDFFHRKVLCSTLAGNNVDYFTIAEEVGTPMEEREGVVVMARVHPGETVSSWMMKGLIDFLISDNPEAAILRKNFVFKIIPMMNPDGVITGNYRTSLAGCDLNRRWGNPNEVLHPEVFYAKQMILKFASQRKLALICDLHGHSGAYNIFMYGNNIKEEPYSCKVFPFILSKINTTFRFPQCAFKMSKFKAGTARINLFNELSTIPNIFTLEASFCGTSKGLNDKSHFTSHHLIEMGKDLCRALRSYSYAFDEGKNEFFNNGVKILHDTSNYYKHNNHVTYANANVSTESSENPAVSNQAKKFYCFDKNTVLNELKMELELLKKDQMKNGVVEGTINLNNSNLGVNSQNNINKESLNESDDDSQGSDSEPSVDNFENEYLLKLLPTHAKKKRKKAKKTKINIFTKLGVNKLNNKKIDKSTPNKNNLGPIKTVRDVLKTDIINSQIKSEKEKLNNPSSNLSNQLSISNNNTAKQENKKKTSFPIPNNTLDREKSNVHSKITQQDPPKKKKKDSETQTEEIFFKMHWSYFHSKGFVTLSAKSAKNPVIPSISNRNFSLDNKKQFTFYQEVSRNEDNISSVINLLRGKNVPLDLLNRSSNNNLFGINLNGGNKNELSNSLQIKNKKIKENVSEKLIKGGVGGPIGTSKNINIKNTFNSVVAIDGIKGNKYLSQVSLKKS